MSDLIKERSARVVFNCATFSLMANFAGIAKPEGTTGSKKDFSKEARSS